MGRNKMKAFKRTGLLVLLAANVSVVGAAEFPISVPLPEIDTTDWKCKFCPTEKGWSGDLDLGLWWVSHDSFKYGEYTGLNEDGGYLHAGGNVRYRGDDAYYWDVKMVDLGLDSRRVEVEGGRQGTYKLKFSYDELPHFISDTARTPFLGEGSDSLTLPGGWVRAGSTAGMTALPGSLRNVEIENKRERVGIGLTVPHREWQYAVNYRHETRDGTKRASGAFFFNAAQFLQPVDYETDEIDASATYVGQKWHARLAYYGSMFSNDNKSLTWQNPFTGLVPGADSGQLALPPDNEFHQLIATGGYQFTKATRATAEIAVGRGTQNENFLAATLNPTLVVPALPRNSLDGKVDTLNANLKVVSALTDRLRLNAAYVHNDRDNKTPQAAYPWVSTDTFLNPATRTNLPYSFTQDTLKLAADYRLASTTRVAAGFDYERFDRTFQEVDKTKENTLWGKAVVRYSELGDLTLKVAHSDRDADSYDVVPETSPPQNPLMRKYNMADRIRDSIGAQATLTPKERITLGVGVDISEDEYSNSSIGLIDARDLTFSADASLMLTKSTSFHLFANHERVRSRQAGSQGFSTPDWFAENDDRVNTAGVGVKYAPPKSKYDIGADYAWAQSRGEVNVTTGAPAAAFPDLTSRLNSLKLYANYRLKGGLSLHGAYWYERYTTADWMLDGVSPGTIPNVLSLGEDSPSYNVSVVLLSLRYKF